MCVEVNFKVAVRGSHGTWSSMASGWKYLSVTSHVGHFILRWLWNISQYLYGLVMILCTDWHIEKIISAACIDLTCIYASLTYMIRFTAFFYISQSLWGLGPWFLAHTVLTRSFNHHHLCIDMTYFLLIWLLWVRALVPVANSYIWTCGII